MNLKFLANKLTALSIILFLAYPAAVFAGEEKHQLPHAQQQFSDIQKWVEIFESPDRAEWQKPDEVVQKMNLKSGDVVADIGAGTGYFTRLFAKAVGTQGRAIGLDIEASMVEYMKEDARKLSLKNYEARVVKPDDPELAAKSVDVIFICNTYHHIEGRGNYLKRLASALKHNGRIVIVDFYKKPLPVGPRSSAHKISEEEVEKEFQKAGYRLIRSLDFLPYQYFLEFGL